MCIIVNPIVLQFPPQMVAILSNMLSASAKNITKNLIGLAAFYCNIVSRLFSNN